MSQNREPLILTLVGFLIGVLFTLLVVRTQSSANAKGPGSTFEFYAILVVLLVLTVLLLAVYLKPRQAILERSSSAAAELRTIGPLRSSSGGKVTTPTGEGQSKETRPSGGVQPGTTAKLQSGYSYADPQEQPGTPLPQDSDYWDSATPTEDSESPTTVALTSHADRLVEVWQTYHRNGDGKFNANGLRRFLESAGINAEVLAGERVEAGDNVLAVDIRDGRGSLYLLPNFNKPAIALSTWFQIPGSGSRAAVIQRLIRPATARRVGSRINVESRGEVV